MSKKKKNKKNRHQGNWKNPLVVAILKPMESKNNVGASAGEMAKAAAFGLIGTGLGMAIGKPSLLVGLGASLVANYLDFQPLKIASVGMIATGGYQFAKGVNGAPAEGIEGVKDRLKEFGANLKENLYINKVFKKKSGVNGVGEVQQFRFPDQGHAQLEMGTLENIEEEIAASGRQFGELNATAFEELQILGTEEAHIL